MANSFTSSPELETLSRLAEGSAIVRVLRRGVHALERTLEGSRSRVVVKAALAAVAPARQEEKWQAWGITLITAVALHLALLFARHANFGWRSLVIPAVIAAQGVLLVLAARGRLR
jgi:hypothetical protein